MRRRTGISSPGSTCSLATDQTGASSTRADLVRSGPSRAGKRDGSADLPSHGVPRRQLVRELFAEAVIADHQNGVGVSWRHWALTQVTFSNPARPVMGPRGGTGSRGIVGTSKRPGGQRRAARDLVNRRVDSMERVVSIPVERADQSRSTASFLGPVLRIATQDGIAERGHPRYGWPLSIGRS